MFKEHVAANIQCQELLQKSIEMRKAGKVREAEGLEKKATACMKRMIEIERKLKT
jgi:hypothetical protein